MATNGSNKSKRNGRPADGLSKEQQLHAYQARPDGEWLTSNQGVRIPHTDDSLKAGERGPTLMEDSTSVKRSPTSTTSGFLSASYTREDPARTAISRCTNRWPSTAAHPSCRTRRRRRPYSCASRRCSGRAAQPTPSATYAALPPNSTPTPCSFLGLVLLGSSTYCSWPARPRRRSLPAPARTRDALLLAGAGPPVAGGRGVLRPALGVDSVGQDVRPDGPSRRRAVRPRRRAGAGSGGRAGEGVRRGAVLARGLARDGGDVLDVGAGSGVWGLAIAAATEGRLTALDRPLVLDVTQGKRRS